MSKTPKIYLAGSIEKSEDPFTWRNEMEEFLSKYHTEVYNPCKEEKYKLKGLKCGRLPKDMTSWHQLKSSPEPHLRRRFMKYMKIIRETDLEAVGSSDFIIVRWDAATQQGAGTLHEIIHSAALDIPVYVVAEHEFPAWAWALVYESDGAVFKDFDELKDFLSDELEENDDK